MRRGALEGRVADGWKLRGASPDTPVPERAGFAAGEKLGICEAAPWAAGLRDCDVDFRRPADGMKLGGVPCGSVPPVSSVIVPPVRIVPTPIYTEWNREESSTA